MQLDIILLLCSAFLNGEDANFNYILNVINEVHYAVTNRICFSIYVHHLYLYIYM